MLRQTETTRDPEAILLSKIYALILSWSDDNKTDETRNAELTRVNTSRAKSEVSDDKK